MSLREQNIKANRLVYMDTLKLLAALLVFMVHFISIFAPGLASYWIEGISSYILYGVSGKLSVCFFFVLSGYFAMKRTEPGKYIVKRYLRFVIPIFVVETGMLIFMILFRALGVTPFPLDINNQYLNLTSFNGTMFLKGIFFLDDSIVSTYWCNWELFAGPIILILLNMYVVKVGSKYIFLFFAGTVFFLCGEIWYTLCMLGGALRLITKRENRWMHKWYIKLILLIVIYFLIRHPDSNEAYLLKGIACMCLVIFVMYSPSVQKVLEKKIFRILSIYSFEIFLLHTPVNLFFVYFVYGYMLGAGVRLKWTLIVSFIVSLTVTILLCRGLHILSEYIERKVDIALN